VKISIRNLLNLCLLCVGEGEFSPERCQAEASSPSKKRGRSELIRTAPIGFLGIEHLIVLLTSSVSTFLIIIVDQAAATAAAIVEVKLTKAVTKAQSDVA